MRYLPLIILITVGCKQEYYQYKETKILKNESLPKLINVLKNENLISYYNVQEIPSTIKKTLRSWNKEFAIVNPGRDYDATDIDTRLPSRQLLAILKDESSFIMVYNHGGFGHHRHVMFFELRRDEVTDFWVGYGRSKAEVFDKAELINWFSNNETKLQTNFVELGYSANLKYVG